MGFQAAFQRYKPKPLAVPPIAPYYGTSTLALATQSMVLGLANRGPTPGQINTDFFLSAPSGSGLYLWFAYPASYGPAQFFDVDSNFYGGWDGANDNPNEVFGPAIVNVSILGNVVPFYVYRTDYPELGTVHFIASPDPAG